MRSSSLRWVGITANAAAQQDHSHVCGGDAFAGLMFFNLAAVDALGFAVPGKLLGEWLY
jgi:hypothetical protein